MSFFDNIILIDLHFSGKQCPICMTQQKILQQTLQHHVKNTQKSPEYHEKEDDPDYMPSPKYHEREDEPDYMPSPFLL